MPAGGCFKIIMRFFDLNINDLLYSVRFSWWIYLVEWEIVSIFATANEK